MTQSRNASSDKRNSLRRLVEECFRREAGPSIPIPGDDADLIETGIFDSMAWVSFLRTVESASGAGDLGSSLNDRSATLAAVFSALQDTGSSASEGSSHLPRQTRHGISSPAIITGSSSALASRLIPSEEVDRAFGMPLGKLCSRAGIESLAYAADGENEVTLGARAA